MRSRAGTSRRSEGRVARRPPRMVKRLSSPLNRETTKAREWSSTTERSVDASGRRGRGRAGGPGAGGGVGAHDGLRGDTCPTPRRRGAGQLILVRFAPSDSRKCVGRVMGSAWEGGLCTRHLSVCPPVRLSACPPVRPPAGLAGSEPASWLRWLLDLQRSLLIRLLS